ncbi:MerR family redox-sensitive transcriptional activator SoxR [Streptomyces sp. DvalAA-21]|nr:MerR family redox-sensitive transcriptional activator SoxR [Streptomyces sp. DvalAA-21]RAJ26877.1 MerR family redox-sensitive transcriptional activator SoxR [Streptomyces sp. DpondAA-E10]RAJ40342.1 MerR family redox-sensitive transcriptional activator SoxR [Streptomyces sp. DpondAA-A50]SCE14932.1 MerR family transcriptional regulator, redox-sensitive transcriptional activator SoxR [Streptomyces sp. DpondAA-F4a]SCM12974.1 MerR family transcriptional regulator, redox-sensitive transcriptional 
MSKRLLSMLGRCVPVNDGPAGAREAVGGCAVREAVGGCAVPASRLGGVPQIPQTLHELTVGQLSARSGAAVSALHFYESKGLISSRRTSGNQRRYTRDALRRVAFVRAAQRVGIPLATIRQALAELPDERTPNRDDWARLSRAWRSELDERIEQLGRLRDHLTDCIGCGCLSLEACVLSNPDDISGEKIAGSRLMPERRAGKTPPEPRPDPAQDPAGPCADPCP